jgi:tetratricopeptide (TPR) repeat protein
VQPGCENAYEDGDLPALPPLNTLRGKTDEAVVKTAVAKLLFPPILSILCLLHASASMAAGDLGVANTRAEGDAAAQIAPALSRWLEHQLGQAGLATLSIDDTSQDAIATASEQGLGAVLLSRLQTREGMASLQLLLMAPRTDTVLTASDARVPLEDLGKAASDGLVTVFARLGVGAARPTPATLDELVCTAQALALRQAGDTHGAYRAVQGKLSPLAMEMREELVEQAWSSEGAAIDRARVIAATGEPASAWRLIQAEAKAALENPKADPGLLIAAGDVSLARGDAAAAMRFFEAAAERARGAVAGDAQLGIARVATLQAQPAAARRALSQALKLRPDDPRPALELSRLVDDPDSAGQYLLQAGERAARRLDVERARRHLRRASELSPKHRGASMRARASLESRVGRPAIALEALGSVPGADQDAEAQLALARAYRSLGKEEGSRGAYLRALEIEPRQADALVELGALEVGAGNPESGLRYLREAQGLEPTGLTTRRELATALAATGDATAAMEMRDALARETGSGSDLRELAAIQLAEGDGEAARASLDRAIALDTYDGELRTLRAKVLTALGSAEAAPEAEFAASLLGRSDLELRGDGQETSASALSLAELVETFAVQIPNAHRRTVVSLGTRRPGDWKSLAERVLHPQAPDLPRIDQALDEAIAHHFRTIETMSPEDAGLGSLVGALYDFGSEGSLDAQAIAQMNQVLGIDGIILTQLWTRPKDPGNPLCAPGDYEVEIRMLVGNEPEMASILANVECLAGGHLAYARWNPIAIGIAAALGFLILFPLLRGWGTLQVSIELPQRTKGFFSIHINEKPDQVVREVVDKKTMREKTRSKRRFDLLRRFDRHMAGGETTFRLIPARKTAYTVTVAGPLLDSKGHEIIGHFFQEQPIRVRRGKTAKAVFDLRPRECAVEFRLTQLGAPAAGARCAVRGDASSVRYARDGVAYLYLGPGNHTLVVASQDAAAEIPLEIESLESAIPVRFDFEDDECVFRDCPDAVEPYVLGDLEATVSALSAAGQDKAAHLLRAELLRAAGRANEAAVELEAAGETLGAAELRARGEDFEGSAELFERAGDFDRAADAYRAAGQLDLAGRCYEQVFDYANALDCWRETGDSEREMFLLEKTGEFMEAATIAHELGDVERALANLQQVDARHTAYGDACALIAAIMIQRGDVALAIAKFEEAMGSCGVDNTSISTLEGYANALEQAGRHREALSAYEAIARRDVTRAGVNRRIEALRHNLSQQAAAPSCARGEASTEPMESRYELLEEIGRGGMGVVYKARDTRLGRVVALKRLPENLREHPNAVALFEREARAAAALNHINIVTLFDAGEEGGNYFITMELLEGQPLNAILERASQLSARDTARLGIQIAAGLQYAHDQRIVHRDIKTSNLFFTKDHTVKIMDFGIAKSLEEVRRTTTVVGGTPYYMAPEQAAGESVDHRADLYAFGVTLFQMATGALPFGDGDVTYRHRHEEPPDPREFVAVLPERLSRIILQLMSKDPENRPQSAAAVATELRTLLEEIAAKK